ncbi:hypothetical protein CCR96_20645 [Halochromatium roseum]|nr:hypothetical protein [Halochromatium roseum]
MSRTHRIAWHELLGKALTDALIGLPYSVSTEEELALRSQRLDVLIIEQAAAVSSNRRGAQVTAADLQCPDGLDDLAAHNLLSFKAAGAPYDAWALEELNSHYVTYRKLASIRALQQRPADDERPISEPSKAYPLLPALDFRSYAVATHFPRKLIKQLPPGSCQRTEQPGIYTLRAGTREVRLIGINDLRALPHNAPWRLFSSNKAQQSAALHQYHPRSEIGLHLCNLLTQHLLGDGNMAHTFEDMQREAHEWLKASIRKLDPEEVLQCYGPEERLKGLDPEERLKGLDPEVRLKGLDPDEVFSRFDPATIEAWLKKHRRGH